jgi:hypothetical protein
VSQALYTGCIVWMTARLDAQWEIAKDDQRRLDEQAARLATLESAQRPFNFAVARVLMRLMNDRRIEGADFSEIDLSPIHFVHEGDAQPAQHVCDHRCDSENGHHSWPPPQPAPPGGGEAQPIWDCPSCDFACASSPNCDDSGVYSGHHRDCGGMGIENPQFHRFNGCIVVPKLTNPAPGDATGSDEELVARARQQARRERDGAAREITGCSVMAAALFDALATRLDELRRERDTLLLTGNALAVNCDGNAKPHGLVAFIPANGPCAACEQLARADAAEAKVAGIAGLVRKIGPDTVADCAHIIRKDWPLCAEILDAALTTPAQRSEGDES